MTEKELRNVKDFAIYNDEVKVTFDGRTDITGLDLDEIVSLGHRSVEIYPESGRVPLPEVGKGLNKPATIEFYKWPMPKKYTGASTYEKKLKEWAESQNAELRFYDADAQVTCIHVNNFNLKD